MSNTLSRTGEIFTRNKVPTTPPTNIGNPNIKSNFLFFQMLPDEAAIMPMSAPSEPPMSVATAAATGNPSVKT